MELHIRLEGRLRGQAPQRLAQPDPVAVGTGALSRRYSIVNSENLVL